MNEALPSTFGPYTLLKRLAKGGMGEIFLARSGGLHGFEKYYAIKRLLPQFLNDLDTKARFIDEAKLGASLRHPNIVQVHNLGQVGHHLYMATEFVDGFDLRRVLRFCRDKNKTIPLDVSLFIIREVLNGLEYAHAQVDADGAAIDLIHRDISPQNILVSFEGEVKIIDFGLAKSTQRSVKTKANVVLGNLGYMSPEQAKGTVVVDERTDIYSTGIVFFELVTQSRRFNEKNPLRLHEMLLRPEKVSPSDRKPGLPKKIDKIHAHAAHTDPDQRYPDVQAFRHDVELALQRINPHVSRATLAAFLEHLFLDGKALPAVDNSALDSSIAVRNLGAGTHPQADEGEKSSLAQPPPLADDSPVTGTHAVLHGCRIGQQLTHEELVNAEQSIVVELKPAVVQAESTDPTMIKAPIAENPFLSGKASVRPKMERSAPNPAAPHAETMIVTFDSDEVTQLRAAAESSSAVSEATDFVVSPFDGSGTETSHGVDVSRNLDQGSGTVSES